ncbi:unnamed protein product [Wickerhamomyces anomalus]
MSSTEDLSALFNKLGLEDVKIKEILKNKKVSNSFESILKESSNIEYPLDKTKRLLLHQLAILSKGETIPNRSLITEGILNDELNTSQRVDEAFKYVKANGESSTKEELNKVSGVGIVVTEDQVKNEVRNYIQANKSEIEEKRYQFLPKILANVRTIPELKWANPSLFKPIIDEELLKLLGPKDERDVVKKEKKSKKPAANTTTSKDTKEN